MCRGVWRAKVSGGVLQFAELHVRGNTGEKEELAYKGGYGQTASVFNCVWQRLC